MSVQSEIDRITGAVTDQTDLIQQITTALAGKAAGDGSGGGMKTVTVLLHPNNTVLYQAQHEVGSRVIVDFNGGIFPLTVRICALADGTTLPITGGGSECYIACLSSSGIWYGGTSSSVRKLGFIMPSQDITFTFDNDD